MIRCSASGKKLYTVILEFWEQRWSFWSKTLGTGRIKDHTITMFEAHLTGVFLFGKVEYNATFYLSMSMSHEGSSEIGHLFLQYVKSRNPQPGARYITSNLYSRTTSHGARHA